MTERNSILQIRGKTHGSFPDNAAISQSLKSLFRQHATIAFDNVKLEALDMIALKLSRILSSDAGYRDHWRDISGYALLAMESCAEDKAPF